MSNVESWAEVGDRVRQARVATRLSQAVLAEQLGIDRSALVRIEAGQRQISALELFRLSELLGLSIGYFVSQAPQAVISRRQELSDDADPVSRDRFLLDAALEDQARDAEWLLSRDFLAAAPASDSKVTDRNGHLDPVATAQRLRQHLGMGSGPIHRMADTSGQAGLHVLVLDKFDAGASLILHPGFGVAIIGGAAAPGRRRLTAAHELGHFVLEDEYTTDIGVAASRDEREQKIDSFAAEFLLPSTDLRLEWESQASTSARERLIQVAARYRVSWSVAVHSARNQGLITPVEATRLKSATPQRGDFLEQLGHVPEADLMPGDTSATWRQAVLAAWRMGDINATRAVELLHGAIDAEDLPAREEPDLP